MTSPALVQIGDHNRVPSGATDDYVLVQCEGEEIGIGIDVPQLGDLMVVPDTCNGLNIVGMPIPADTPLPFQYADTHGLYSLQVENHAGSSGGLGDNMDARQRHTGHGFVANDSFSAGHAPRRGGAGSWLVGLHGGQARGRFGLRNALDQRGVFPARPSPWHPRIEGRWRRAIVNRCQCSIARLRRR